MAVLTVQSTGVTDTSMFSGDPTGNYGTSANFYVGTTAGASVLRGLVKFDISSIPAGSTINSAILTLTAEADQTSNARTLSVYRVLRAWVETEATWNIFSTGNNWGTAGCSNTTTDREATDIGTVAVGAVITDGDAFAITLTASQIQQIITGGSFTNNGFLCKVDTEANDEVDYYSTNHATSARRPKLVITYTATVTSSDDLSGYGEF